MKPGWKRYRAREPCGVCGHRTSGCAYCGPLENPHVVLCLRIDRGSVKEAANGMGWIHHMRDDPNYVPPAPKPKEPPLMSNPEMESFARICEADLMSDQLEYQADRLGVEMDALRRLGMGYSERHAAYTFPMRSPANLIIGIRLRSDEGKKWAISGSVNALFIPRRNKIGGPLYVVEGPTDTAAALTIGLAAIGRPSNTSGRDMIVAYAKRFLPRRSFVIIKNNDPVGTMAKELTDQGAESLREMLLSNAASPAVQIVSPPVKDMRAWLHDGCKIEDVFELVEEHL